MLRSLGIMVTSSYSPTSNSSMVYNPPSMAATSYNGNDSDSDDGTVARELEDLVNNTAPDDPLLNQISHEIFNAYANGQTTQWMVPTRQHMSVPSPFNQTVRY